MKKILTVLVMMMVAAVIFAFMTEENKVYDLKVNIGDYSLLDTSIEVYSIELSGHVIEYEEIVIYLTKTT